MATHRLPIYLGLMPDPTDSTDPPFWEPFSILATNDQWHRMVLRFGSNNAAQPTTRIEAHGAFAVPINYASAANLIVQWTATGTSGNVAWDADYRAMAVGEGLDQATQQEQVTATDAAPGTALDFEEVTIALTDANFAVKDLVQFHLARDGTAGADTMALSAILVGLAFEYSD